MPLEDVSALSRSTVDGTLELLYQPEVDLRSGAIVAMEGLLRWRHADAVLSPGAFLDLAERTGHGRPIGDWVLQTGAAEAAVWQRLPGPSRQLWLNVSTAQVREPGFAACVAAVVAEHALVPGVLGLEVHEGTVRELGPDAGPLLRDLRDAGVGLAMDDFASWYSSLGAMALLPLSAVKLAPRHVRGIDESPYEPVAAAVIEAAHEHGVYVVAEGVETWGEAVRLTELGCDRAHGWLFSSAQRADKARWLLTQGRGWHGSPVSTATRALPVPRAAAL